MCTENEGNLLSEHGWGLKVVCPVESLQQQDGGTDGGTFRKIPARLVRRPSMKLARFAR